MGVISMMYALMFYAQHGTIPAKAMAAYTYWLLHLPK